MKFGYDSADSKYLIQNYSIENGKIIINFLDGSHYDIDLTENNEQTLLNKMLDQAEKRNNSNALHKALFSRKVKLLPTLSNGILATLMLGNYIVYSKKIVLLIGLLASLCAGKYGGQFKSYSDEVNELIKYDIYLSIRERLEKINDPNIFSGIDNGQTLLNINTLDNYSLKEIKQIRKNLALCEKYYSSFERSDSDPVLVKKISK